MRLRNESRLMMILVEISTKSPPKPRESDMLIYLKLIPSMYVGVHSPASGSAVLRWDTDVATDHTGSLEFQPWSGLQYTSSIWPYAKHTNRMFVQYSIKWLMPVSLHTRLSSEIHVKKTPLSDDNMS
jgi:hypothetical protein